MLTKNTFERNERLINVAVMGLKSVELKASSQHNKCVRTWLKPCPFLCHNINIIYF